MADNPENPNKHEIPAVPQRPPTVDDPAQPIQIDYKGKEPLSAQEQVVAKFIGEEFNQWDSWRKPWEYLWNECYKLYLNISEQHKTPTRSRIFIPAVFQVIEAAVPKLMTLVFGNTDFFEVVAADPKKQPIADIVKKMLSAQLLAADFFLKFLDFIKQLMLYGTSYFYVYWKVVRKWVWKREPIRGSKTFFGITVSNNAILGWKEEKVYEVVERRPEVEVLDVLDVFPDPEARTEADARGIWIRSWMNIEEVKELGAGDFPVFDPVNVRRIETGTEKTLQESRSLRNSIRGIQTGYRDKNQVELLTRWGLYDLDGDGIREETLVVIANRKYLMRAMPNPFHHQNRPVIRATMFPVPLEWFGVGLIEPIIPLQHELNTVRRQRLDNVNLVLNRMWKINTFADVDLEALVSSPNGIILTDDMDAVQPLPTNDVTQSAYADASAIQNDIENTTTPKSLQGTPESGRLGRTASGAQLIIGQALEKFGTAAKMVEENALKQVLRFMYDLDLQFIDDSEQMKEFSDLFAGVALDPELIRTQLRFQMKGISELIGKEGKINQIVSFMGVFGPLLAPDTISTLAKNMYKLMGLDPDEVNIQAPGALQPGPKEAAASGASGAIEAQIQQNGSATAFPGAGNVEKGNIV